MSRDPRAKLAVFNRAGFVGWQIVGRQVRRYGITYTPNDFLSYTVTYDLGELRTDDATGDIDRQALSFGVR